MRPPAVFQILGFLGERLPLPALSAFALLLAAPFVFATAPLHWLVYRRLAAPGVPLPGFPGYLWAFSRSLASSGVTICLLSGNPAAPTPRPVACDAWPEIEALRREGKGLVLASAHLGDVVLLLSALTSRGLPVTFVMQQTRTYRWLESPSLRLAELGAAAAACLAALGRNEAVLLLCDRDRFPGNRRVSFFGAPVSPPHGVARLAVAAGAPILPVACLAEPRTHRLVAEPAIAPTTVEEVEIALLGAVEKLIERAPAQWRIFLGPWTAAS